MLHDDYNDDIILIMAKQEDGEVGWYKEAIGGGRIRRWVTERFSPKFRDSMTQLRKIDENLRDWVGDLKGDVKKIRKAFKSKRIIDVAILMSQLNAKLNTANQYAQEAQALQESQIEDFEKKNIEDLLLLKDWHERQTKTATAGWFTDLARKYMSWRLTTAERKRRNEKIKKVMDLADVIAQNTKRYLGLMKENLNKGDINEYIRLARLLGAQQSKFEQEFADLYNTYFAQTVQEMLDEEREKIEEERARREEELSPGLQEALEKKREREQASESGTEIPEFVLDLPEEEVVEEEVVSPTIPIEPADVVPESEVVPEQSVPEQSTPEQQGPEQMELPLEQQEDKRQLELFDKSTMESGGKKPVTKDEYNRMFEEMLPSNFFDLEAEEQVKVQDKVKSDLDKTVVIAIDVNVGIVKQSRYVSTEQVSRWMNGLDYVINQMREIVVREENVPYTEPSEDVPETSRDAPVTMHSTVAEVPETGEQESASPQWPDAVEVFRGKGFVPTNISESHIQFVGLLKEASVANDSNLLAYMMLKYAGAIEDIDLDSSLKLLAIAEGILNG